MGKAAAATFNESDGDCTGWGTILLLILTFFLLGKVRIYKLVQLDPQTNHNQLYDEILSHHEIFSAGWNSDLEDLHRETGEVGESQG